MKITLVAVHPYRSPQAVPLACAFLAEALRCDAVLRERADLRILDFYLADDPVLCAEAIAAESPDLVGFSAYLWNRDHIMRTGRELSRLLPEAALCAGGPEATAAASAFLDDGPFAFVVRGEGESTFVEAVRAILAGTPLSPVPGLALRGEPSASLPTPIDPATVPSPYLSGLLDPALPGGALWQLSRGCDFACSFCFDHKGSGGVRRLPLERIEEELRLFARLRVPQVFVLDSTFNKVPQRAKEILRLIAEIAPEVHFHFEVRSEFIDAEMAELFASVTCSLQIGLQSADAAVLRGVGRGFDRDDFVYRASLLNASGAVFGFDIIYGLPGDTPELFRSSLDFALSLYPNHLDIFPLAVLPGTRLYAKRDGLGLRHLDAPPYTVRSTPGFTPEQLEEAGRIAAACDIFYSRGKAVAWFNGILHALKLSPSSFLTSFAGFLAERGIEKEQEITERDIWGLQREFLARIFPERKKERLLPLALDLADYHYHYAAALMTPPPPRPGGRRPRRAELMKAPLRLAPSATLAPFHYEILEILDAGEVELPEFASRFKAARSFAVIYPAAGEVCTESLSEVYFRLLHTLDGSRPAEAACRELRLPKEEALEFLEFAFSEGIVTIR